jgi:hypothetical protein
VSWMGMSFLSSVVEGAIGDLQERSRKRLYAQDPQAWLSDVLGKRWYSRQEEIVDAFLRNPRIAVKCANGCGKSAVVADLITWQVAVSNPADTLCIVSAPTLSQIEKVIFAYLKVNKGKASSRGLELPGRITETLAWKLDGEQGSEFLVFGKRPSDRDIVSSFQGTRKMRTMVFLDEAGGLPSDMFTAAEAVATGAESRILAIGNPDRRGTEFHKIFTDSKLSQDWDLHTISAFDLPTFTGEQVYDDEVKQANLLSGLTSVEWVEHKQRAWGIDSARYKAKVLGEFPDEADNTFFSQEVIDKAIETEIVDDESIRPVLGVDVARFGSDENRMYINRGGRVRLYSDDSENGGAWSKTDLITTARKVHEAAQRVGARLVNVDVNGVGGGVVDALVTLNEFSDAVYDVGAIAGSNASPDNLRWFNARSYQYDMLRQMMAEGKIDIDYDDSDLREELVTQTYKFSAKGAIQMVSKDEMKKSGLKSPDSLDAAILSVIDFVEQSGPTVGEIVEYEPVDVDNAFYRESYW